MNTNAPSLISGGNAAYAANLTASTAHSLMDLMYDGFYALFMLKNGNGPLDNNDFISKMTQFLDDFGRGAKKQGASADDIDAAKYAFCAAVDEIILRSPFSIREAWERRPLQLVLFGDQLAGENFFIRLESLRARGSVHLQALEVFHMCLLLGFQGRYILEGQEKLNYLTARLGDEIAHMKGKSAGFAPHAERPDQIINKLRNDVPLWVLCSVFALITALGYIGLRGMLVKNTEARMHAYNDVVKLAPRAANLTITLP
ncbi:type IVB secretion system protein IcmH/DotU [Janthinobacterium agaricidamnosum]|uniref:Type IV / VI secretion system, DotU family domain protein n=1 Tax=Janthinobacterium agaricidamnosum NBRC 102515 = DSM 9628 TaxID=1349767 RepID=W0V765_9BURK|nr:type IVB secretion system protein IcmH/DotU [Janthinobacterium agaricidamnosum]CDG83193.1 type IV / VI secretion system, DotU family domain protein [Janthinobacterium agaricidamnosum NBRC 102515 = DSM 9628]